MRVIVLVLRAGIMYGIDTVIRLNNQIERRDSIRRPRHLATAPADDARWSRGPPGTARQQVQKRPEPIHLEPLHRPPGQVHRAGHDQLEAFTVMSMDAFTLVPSSAR